MSAQGSPAPGAQWLRWFPAAAPGAGGRWRLIRFAQVDAGGAPLGKAITAMTPGNQPRLFHTEASALRCAAMLNMEDAL